MAFFTVPAFRALAASLVICGAVGASVAPGAAQATSGAQRIAVVVDEEAISVFDVEQRLKLFLASTGAEPPADQIDRLRQQVLRALVDESLQLQESRRYSISVSDREVQSALDQIASQNSMDANQIRDALGRDGVRFETLERQIKAELSWRKLVVRRFGSRVRVSDAEVDGVFDRLQAQGGRTEVLMSEIFVAVDQPSQEGEARRAADGIVVQLRGGAPFPAMARQFSQAPSAASGGDAGWVDPSEVLPEIAAALGQIQPGQVAGPIRTAGGYYIIGLRDTRRADAGAQMAPRFVLKQIVVDLTAGADDDASRAAFSEARQAAASISTCADVDEIKDDFGAKSGDLGELGLNELPSDFRAAVLGLSRGGVSAPVRTDDGVHVLVVCERTDSDAARRAKTAIRDRLESQEIGLIARRYLRDLRRDAVIEFR